MPKVVLIRPHVSPLKPNRSASRPPTGLLYVAAVLIQHGFDVEIIDQSVEMNYEEKIIDALKGEVLCVGITCLTGQMIINGIEIVKIVRKYSQCPVVWGGVHPSLEPATTINSKYVDIIVLGNGEETMLELTRALRYGADLKDVNGIIYKINGRIFHNPPRKPYDLNNLPPLPLNLVNIENYRDHYQLSALFHFKNSLSISFETSRGCTHKCTYCCNANKNYKNMAKWRSMTAIKLADAVEKLIINHNIRSFAFIDDNFFVDISRVKEFINEIQRRSLAIEWFADIRMDTIIKNMNVRFLEELEKSGLRSLGIGLESGSNRILNNLRKGETREVYIEANRMLANTSIACQYGLIQGMPNESVTDVEDTYSLVAILLIDNPNAVPTLNKLLPTPNTPIFEECKKHGFRPPEKFENWAELCDTGWNRGPAIWMDKKSAKLIMSLSYYSSLINLARSSRAVLNKSSFWNTILVFYSKIVLSRAKRRKFSVYTLESLFYRMVRLIYSSISRII